MAFHCRRPQDKRSVRAVTGGRRQADGRRCLRLRVGVEQVFQQDAPRHGINHKVMRNDMQAGHGLAGRCHVQHKPQQGPLFDIQARLVVRCALSSNARQPAVSAGGGTTSSSVAACSLRC